MLKDKSQIKLFLTPERNNVQSGQKVFFLCHCTFLFSVTYLLSYAGIWPYVTLIAYEIKALQYTHYQGVFLTLDVDKWTFEVAQESS